jgi:hypothetical protein
MKEIEFPEGFQNSINIIFDELLIYVNLSSIRILILLSKYYWE